MFSTDPSEMNQSRVEFMSLELQNNKWYRTGVLVETMTTLASSMVNVQNLVKLRSYTLIDSDAKAYLAVILTATLVLTTR